MLAAVWMIDTAALAQTPSPPPESTPLIPPSQPESTPLIPPSGSPGAELPTQPSPPPPTTPLIPQAPIPGQAPTPPQPALPTEKLTELDEQFAEAIKVRRVCPPAFLPVELMDAVRVALYRNSDIRLAVEDAQVAKGAVKQATGEFDTKVITGFGYGQGFVSPPEQGRQVDRNDVREILSQALGDVLTTLAADPGAVGNIDALVDGAVNNAAASNIADEVTQLFFSFDASKQLRNGISIDFEYSPELLDQEDQPTFPPITHQMGISIDLPLTKFGKIANAGDEMAALVDYDAALLNLRHTATKSAFGTVQAYWKTLAALEKFYYADRSYRISDANYELSEELVKGDAIPATELSLAQARKAESFASRIAALLEIFNAAKELAISLGFSDSEVKRLPLPVESFPSLVRRAVDRLSVDGLIDFALSRRYDRLAALRSVESNRIKAEKARIDLRPDLKLKVGGGIAFIDNEATGRGSGTGTEPTYELGLGFSITPANNGKEGKLIDAQANLHKSIISMEGVSRDIAANIYVGVESLRGLIDQIAEGERALTLYTKSLSDLREKLRLGAATLTDMVDAEQRLSTAATTLISARSNLAQEIAKLRYETATLLTNDVVYRLPGFPHPVQSLKIDRRCVTTLPELSQESGPSVLDLNYEPNRKPDRKPSTSPTRGSRP